MLKILLATLGFTMAAATLIPYISLPYWWIRAFDFPRSQFAALSAATLGLYPLVFSGSHFDYLLIATVSTALLVQAFFILPFYGLYPAEVKQTQPSSHRATVSLITANVLMPNRRAQDLLEIIHQHTPDIVLTLETNNWWETALKPLEAHYPYTVKCPLDNLYGMHLYSKLPLHSTALRYIIEEDIPSIHTQVSLPSGDNIALHFLNPAPPSPSENSESTERDAELLIVGKEIAKAASPQASIVAGDLNDVAWSHTTRLFRRVSGLLDPRIGRGLLNTFHAKYWFIRWPLDHIFHSQEFTLVDMKRLPYFGSDHFPIYMKLHYSPQHRQKHEAPTPATGDHEEANEKIQRAEN